eukprot:TRINITY_DN4740_c0_g1_i1.p1 TRINITY_DN4740_c0_g1~~TRINITY_DN4740_c0_g1_i1.p1  ORF type:complete len:159 (-),score=65.97 TRINITY_DN4740_c0_g1_i1:24-452(-)
MTSGVSVSPILVETFNNFKMNKGDEKLRWFTAKLDANYKSVVLDQKGPLNHTYADFLAALPADDCRYGVFNYEYTMGADGNRAKVVFFAWAPEDSKIKSKMVYASTKDAVKKSLVGIQVEIQGTDRSEVDEARILEACQKSK